MAVSVGWVGKNAVFRYVDHYFILFCQDATFRQFGLLSLPVCEDSTRKAERKMFCAPALRGFDFDDCDLLDSSCIQTYSGELQCKQSMTLRTRSFYFVLHLSPDKCSNILLGYANRFDATRNQTKPKIGMVVKSVRDWRGSKHGLKVEAVSGSTYSFTAPTDAEKGIFMAKLKQALCFEGAVMPMALADFKLIDKTPSPFSCLCSEHSFAIAPATDDKISSEFCRRCGVTLCSSCGWAWVFDMGSWRSVRACSHCAESSSRIDYVTGEDAVRMWTKKKLEHISADSTTEEGMHLKKMKRAGERLASLQRNKLSSQPEIRVGRANKGAKKGHSRSANKSDCSMNGSMDYSTGGSHRKNQRSGVNLGRPDTVNDTFKQAMDDLRTTILHNYQRDLELMVLAVSAEQPAPEMMDLAVRAGVAIAVESEGICLPCVDGDHSNSGGCIAQLRGMAETAMQRDSLGSDDSGYSHIFGETYEHEHRQAVVRDSELSAMLKGLVLPANGSYTEALLGEDSDRLRSQTSWAPAVGALSRPVAYPSEVPSNVMHAFDQIQNEAQVQGIKLDGADDLMAIFMVVVAKAVAQGYNGWSALNLSRSYSDFDILCQHEGYAENRVNQFEQMLLYLEGHLKTALTTARAKNIGGDFDEPEPEPEWEDIDIDF
jgi:hypothetical protein